MDRRRVGLAIGLAWIGLQGWTLAQPSGSPKPLRAETPPARAAFIVLLRLRHDLFLRWKETGKWPDDKEANAALSGHGKYWGEQLREGRAILAGGMKGDYWDNVALIVFRAESEERAQQIVKDDPAVKAYVFQAQVRPFDVSFVTDKYGLKE